MPTFDPFAFPGPDAVVGGTGRLTLDVIVREGEPPRSQAGGTCGNVLANLASLGWQAWPLADLGDDDPGERFCRDLARVGVRLGLLRRWPGEETPVIVHHIRRGDDGTATHSFSSRCPFCGRRLRYYDPVPAGRVIQRLPAVPRTRAFFFDRDSEGAFLLADHCATQGALIVYEPNYAGQEVRLGEALRRARVFKCSREKLPGLVDRLPPGGPALLVETAGAEGLRYLDRRHGEGQWRHLPAARVAVVRDAGGSGDWCTAGLIHLLGRTGWEGLLAASEADIRAALTFGQALGAWNCAFEGARGGAAVPRERFERDVRAILAGEVIDPGADAPAAAEPAGAFCRGCGGSGRVAVDGGG